MKFYVTLLCILLIFAYAGGVAFFYEDKFEADLATKAQNLISNTAGLEQVTVEFQAFDAFLSGEVPSSELRDAAAHLVTSLPAARVVSNNIAYPGFDPDGKSKRTLKSPPDTPLPAKKTSPKIHFTTTEGSLVLTGSVPEITLKSSILKAIALTGKYIDIQARDFLVDPKVAPADWPAELPDLIGLLLTHTSGAAFSLDQAEVNVTATAFDAVSREQILSRLTALEFPGRHLRIDVSEAAPFEIPETAFYFKAVLGAEKFDLQGRLTSAVEKKKLLSVLQSDLPSRKLVDKISVVDDLNTPPWAARLPNVLSLLGSRAAITRLSGNENELLIVAEMKPGHAPQDLADILTLIVGPSAPLKIHLLPPAIISETDPLPPLKPSNAGPGKPNNQN